MSARFLISIGSNIRPSHYVPASVRELRRLFSVTAVSPVFETLPSGPARGAVFWNLTAAIESDLDPDKIRLLLREIENRLDRVRDPEDKFAPRTIDLDLLPAPDYSRQSFVVWPLAWMLPEARDPETGRTYRELADEFRDEAAGFKIVLRPEELG